MVDSGLDAILIKTATIGLNQNDIGKSILQLYSKLCQSEKLYGCNPCGEGGEYETFTLDAPIYKKRIVMFVFVVMVIFSDDAQIICHSYDRDAPVYLYVPQKWHLEEKEQQEIEIEESPCVVHPEGKAELEGVVGDNPLWDYLTLDSLSSRGFEDVRNFSPQEVTSEDVRNSSQGSVIEDVRNSSSQEVTSDDVRNSSSQKITSEDSSQVTSIEIVTNSTDFKSFFTDYTNPPLL